MVEVPVAVPTDSGQLRGTLVNPDSSAGLVVVFRGVAFARPKAGDPGYLGLARDIAAAGFAALYVSFRGFEDAPGVFTMSGWSQDAEAVMAYAAGLGFERIALVGASAGAAIALRHVALHGGVVGVASLASEALMGQTVPRDYVPEFLAKVGRAAPTPLAPADPDAFYADMLAHDPIDYVARISPTPVLFVQGDADAFVSLDTAGRLFEAAAEPKELVVIPGAGHVLRKDPRAVAALISWLAEVLPTG